MTADERLAAELALGLLEGEEFLAARGRAATDPAFAALVAQWEAHLAPLLDEISPIAPPEEIWTSIAATLARGEPNGEVVALRRRLRFWQGAATAGALAACAALAALVLSPQMSGPKEPAAPLVASIPISETPLRLAVTYLPDRGELLVSAQGLTADGVHDHELWLVPDRGQLRSLGVIAPGQVRRVRLGADTARLIHTGSAMVLTREPLGGKPAGAAAGPVVARGAFNQV